MCSVYFRRQEDCDAITDFMVSMIVSVEELPVRQAGGQHILF